MTSRSRNIRKKEKTLTTTTEEVIEKIFDTKVVSF